MKDTPAMLFQNSLSIVEARSEAKRRVLHEGGRKTLSRMQLLKGKRSVSRQDLIEICDGGCAGQLSEEDISDMAFWIYGSSEFEWDESDDVITSTLMDWSAPHIHHRLTKATLRRFRERLSTGDLSVRIV